MPMPERIEVSLGGDAEEADNASGLTVKDVAETHGVKVTEVLSALGKPGSWNSRLTETEVQQVRDRFGAPAPDASVPAAEPVADTPVVTEVPSPEPPTPPSIPPTTGQPSAREERPVMADDKNARILERAGEIIAKAKATREEREVNAKAYLFALINGDITWDDIPENMSSLNEFRALREAQRSLGGEVTTTTPPARHAAPALPNGNQALVQRTLELYDETKDWKVVARRLADAGYNQNDVSAAFVAAKPQRVG
jgi:hypothetical protein